MILCNNNQFTVVIIKWFGVCFDKKLERRSRSFSINCNKYFYVLERQKAFDKNVLLLHVRTKEYFIKYEQQ